MRKLKFSLDVEANALLCPNPSEWFAKSYIQENVATNFKTIPGVKESTKVAKNTFSNLLKAAGCSWSAVDTVLDAEDVSVCPVDVMVQLCQYDLESSFISAKMAKGDTNWTEQEFLAHFWNELGEAVVAEVQGVRWNGDSALSGDNYLKVCDGYLKTLKGKSGAANLGVASITSANIVARLTSVIENLPEAVKGKKMNVRIYMSETNAFYYQLATLGLNTNFNYTGDLQLKFAGYTIAVQPGMSDDYIIAGSVGSFGYAFDGEGDAKNLKIVNLSDTTAEPVLRARIGMKLGFPILNDGAEVSYVRVPRVAPVLATALPAGQSVGEDITLAGTGFVGTSGITVDGVAVVTFTVNNDNSLTLTIPAGASGASDVIVTNLAGVSNTISYTVI